MSLVGRSLQEVRELPARVLRVLRPRRIVEARGLRLTLPADNWITEYRWRSYNTKEPETLDWIDRQMRDGEVFFDIGANIGVYALYAALRRPGIRVVAFEPEYANLHVLRDNVIANRLQDRIEVFSVALTHETGISYLHIQDLTPGAALHTASRERLTVTDGGRPVIWREGIATTTVDAFCEATGWLPHCLKIDVDGAEPSVLAGAAKTLRSGRLRSVLIELDPPTRERSAARLREAGFRCQWRDAARTANEIWGRTDERHDGT